MLSTVALTVPSRWTILRRMIPTSLRNLVKTHKAFAPAYRGYRSFKARRAQRQFANFLRASGFCGAAQAQAIAGDWYAVAQHTQLSQAGILNLEIVARYVVGNGIKGAFVECGTWRGGALSFWASAFLRNGGNPAEHPIYGFDSFEGMPAITVEDGSWAAEMLHGKPIDQLPTDQLQGALKPHAMNAAGEDVCRAIVAASGFPAQHTNIVKGWFQDSLPQWQPRIGPIAVLRLDGDWYESTRACLDNLYDLVVPGGVVIIDDYGYFVGCQRAVNEFLAARGLKPELIVADDCIRYFIKRGP